MKQRFLVALCLASACCIPLLAQNEDATPTRPSASEMVAKRVARLTSLLGLTTAQQSQATTIFTTEQATASGLFSSLRTARTTLKEAVKTNDAGSIATQSTQIGNLTAQETQARATADAALFAILTADQQTKYGELRGGGPGERGFGSGPRHPR